MNEQTNERINSKFKIQYKLRFENFENFENINIHYSKMMYDDLKTRLDCMYMYCIFDLHSPPVPQFPQRPFSLSAFPFFLYLSLSFSHTHNLKNHQPKKSTTQNSILILILTISSISSRTFNFFPFQNFPT